jgi:hypothetical protein
VSASVRVDFAVSVSAILSARMAALSGGLSGWMSGDFPVFCPAFCPGLRLRFSRRGGADTAPAHEQPRPAGLFTVAPSRLERLTGLSMPEVRRVAALPVSDFDAFMQKHSIAKALKDVIALFEFLGVPQALIEELHNSIDDWPILVEVPRLNAAE